MKTGPDPLSAEELRGRLTQPLSVDETAATLRVSRDLIYESCASGELRSLRLGRRVLVPAVVVLEALGLEP